MFSIKILFFFLCSIMVFVSFDIGFVAQNWRLLYNFGLRCIERRAASMVVHMQ